MTGINRRDFITGLAAATGAGACLCGATGCATFTKIGNTPAIATDAYAIDGRTVTVALDKVPKLGTVGGAVKMIDPRLPQPMIIGRIGDSEYAAVSLLCPHRGAEVEYRHEDHQFRCASLGHSTFGTDGARKRGPAKTSLRTFDVKLNPDGRTEVLKISV